MADLSSVPAPCAPDRRHRLRKSENRLQCFVDHPQFFGGEPAGSAPKALHIHRTELFGQHTRLVTIDNYLRTKRGGNKNN